MTAWQVRTATLHPSERMLIRALSVLGVALSWVVASYLVERAFARSAVILPYPWDVLAAVPRLSVFFGPGTEETWANAAIVLAKNTYDSLVRLSFGLLIGGILGIGVGLTLGMSRHARLILQPSLLLLRTIPLFALIPLFLAWFGGTDVGIVSYVAFGVFCMLLINTLAAIQNVSPVITNFARTLGASKVHVYRTVVVPAIVPEVAGGIRVVVGMAWALLIGGELLGAQSGVGRILSLAQQFSDTSRMFIIVAMIIIYTVFLDQLVRFAVAHITRWAPRLN
ncbi:ABC transporter permease subunit [Devosia sp. YIM 151766]|uniref:ABC transporter permease n=1 Tax=Devosia sp. YIM 151766 TaxID=3017325 RepID=UPI00255C769B|nr:ABC transporter permease subunit [Devosia sp. YIM 151766]WIY53559.1 ABC transporter permease subunit [Devosia sp. YIM 151766]